MATGLKCCGKATCSLQQSFTFYEAEGACDAVYEIDNSVGVFLTPEEHGLTLFPNRPTEVKADIAAASGASGGGHGNGGNDDTSDAVPKRPPRLDKGNKAGGPPPVSAGGVAARKRKDHQLGGAGKGTCSTIGCSSFVQKKGVCKKHGGADKCNGIWMYRQRIRTRSLY